MLNKMEYYMVCTSNMLMRIQQLKEASQTRRPHSSAYVSPNKVLRCHQNHSEHTAPLKQWRAGRTILSHHVLSFEMIFIFLYYPSWRSQPSVNLSEISFGKSKSNPYQGAGGERLQPDPKPAVREQPPSAPQKGSFVPGPMGASELWF